MSRLITTATIAAFALAGATAAGAQGMGPWANTSGAFLVDANDDGIVSEDEASRNWAANFGLLDADEDGALSEEEYMDAAAPGGRPGRMAAQRLFENRGARFATMDGDGDKAVTRAEYMAEAEATFKASDSSGDGIVSVWEYRAAHRPF